LFAVSNQTIVPHCRPRPGEGPLDNLLELVVQRLIIAQDVAVVKYVSHRPIEDPVREREILQTMAGALSASGHYRQAGLQFFTDQIEASKVIQRGLHHRWHAHPEEVPPACRSLATEIRPELDQITRQLIRQFESAPGIPRMRRADVAALVDKRLATALPARQLPRLHRHAALFAMRSLCVEAAP
jgi:chorismate mutase